MRRLAWHPATAAMALVIVATVGVAVAAPRGGAQWLWPWLLIGAAAGFATSGST